MEDLFKILLLRELNSNPIINKDPPLRAKEEVVILLNSNSPLLELLNTEALKEGGTHRPHLQLKN